MNESNVEVEGRKLSKSELKLLIKSKMVELESESGGVKVYRLTRDARVLLGSLRSD